MKNIAVSVQTDNGANHYNELFAPVNITGAAKTPIKSNSRPALESTADKAEILFLTSYPPRECGIANYSQDLIKALNSKFSNSFAIKVCAVQSINEKHEYPEEVKYVLDTSSENGFGELTRIINEDELIKMLLIQHEFGFYHSCEEAFLRFVSDLKKPVAIAFHTVLPHPDEFLKSKVLSIASACSSIVVMTKNAENVLVRDYHVPRQKISVIAHGTHLVPHLSKETLKEKYGINGRQVLTTFGLISKGKSIETTLHALPSIVKTCPDVLFLVIGKTHPEVLKDEGEK